MNVNTNIIRGKCAMYFDLWNTCSIFLPFCIPPSVFPPNLSDPAWSSSAHAESARNPAVVLFLARLSAKLHLHSCHKMSHATSPTTFRPPNPHTTGCFSVISLQYQFQCQILPVDTFCILAQYVGFHPMLHRPLLRASSKRFSKSKRSESHCLARDKSQFNSSGDINSKA